MNKTLFVVQATDLSLFRQVNDDLCEKESAVDTAQRKMRKEKFIAIIVWGEFHFLFSAKQIMRHRDVMYTPREARLNLQPRQRTVVVY